MANTHGTLTSLFTDIADAIRTKTGASGAIVADQFPTAISNIATGVKVAAGTYTPSSASKTITISGIGFKTGKIFIACTASRDVEGVHMAYFDGSVKTARYMQGSSWIYVASVTLSSTDDSATVTVSASNFISGRKYNWVAIEG